MCWQLIRKQDTMLEIVWRMAPFKKEYLHDKSTEGVIGYIAIMLFLQLWYREHWTILETTEHKYSCFLYNKIWTEI